MLMSIDPLDIVSQKLGDFTYTRWQRRPFGKFKNFGQTSFEKKFGMEMFLISPNCISI